jgi:hypothetical protein
MKTDRKPITTPVIEGNFPVGKTDLRCPYFSRDNLERRNPSIVRCASPHEISEAEMRKYLAELYISKEESARRFDEAITVTKRIIEAEFEGGDGDES